MKINLACVAILIFLQKEKKNCVYVCTEGTMRTRLS